MNEKQHKISLFRKLIYAGLLFFLVLLLSEMIVSIFYYHQYGKRKLALVELYYSVKTKIKQVKEEQEDKERNYRNQKLARPDSSAKMCEQVYDETITANKFEYDAWVGFRKSNYTGVYINTNGYERKTIPSLISKGNDTLVIWFFGGSTTYGFNVADNETIPSQFALLYRQCSECKNSLVVRNFGIPYFFSYQEYKLITHLLGQNKPPDFVIIADGLNDVKYERNSIDQQPFFADQIKELMRNGSSIFDQNQKTAVHLSEDEKSKKIISNYLEAVERTEDLAKRYNFKPLFVIQPVPFYKYERQQTDPVCSKSVLPLFQSVYPQLEKKFENHPGKLYLGNLHKDAPLIPYIDAVHYSPAFSKQIASAIFERLKPSFKEYDRSK
ncbi:MAG: SGNH/GDSL hydrolase family protein [Chitinophagaceae bacterium]|nr:SGNH/GDSL hydrolase family protein [Chitinophagaceae bacterium]